LTMWRYLSLLIVCAVLARAQPSSVQRESTLEGGAGEREEELLLTRHRRSPTLGFAEALSIATAALASGTSFGASSMLVPLNVQCRTIIENLTKWPLQDPVLRINGGQVTTPPTRVAPGMREAMRTAKIGHTARGTSGVVTWDVVVPEHDVTFYVTIMWSVPYSHDFHSNWMGVGIRSDSSADFDTMYYGHGRWFRRAEYYYNIPTIRHCNDHICIVGTMGTAHRVEAHIKILPVAKEDFYNYRQE